MSVRTRLSFVLALAATALAGCNKSEQAPAPTPAPAKAAEPAKEPLEPLPEVTAVNMDKVVLGRRLYHDTILSGDGTLSCATCHNVAAGGAEARKVSTGIRGQQGPINAPTVLNASFGFVQFWDGRAKDLKEQAEGPVANPLEMGADWIKVTEAVAKDEGYAKSFAAIYGGTIDKGTITDAIAEYEKSLVTPSRFDKFLRGDKTAITEAEQAGYAKFKDVGCPTCHTGIGIGGNSFQKMGLVADYFAARGGELTDADNGRFNVTKNEADKHFFKVPSLRNVALTAPYFHDGSHDSLEAAVKTMAKVQLGKEISDADATSIAVFLKSLTGELPSHAVLPEGDLPKGRTAPEPPPVPATKG
ncbi:MAG: cytochrome-c peroxidase [Myxococcales bacterium]|nr:cytochrome-c peroxidase [Myxococcales bacterium]